MLNKLSHPGAAPLIIFNARNFKHEFFESLSRNTFILKFFMFIYLWERKKVGAGEGQKERETQNPKQDLGSWACQHRAPRGTRTHQPWDHDQSRSWTLNRLSHPGAPILFFFNLFMVLGILEAGRSTGKPKQTTWVTVCHYSLCDLEQDLYNLWASVPQL